MNLENIKKTLGKPYYENEDCLIYCKDSLESLDKLRGETFDLTVTSPPYNIGKEYEKILSLDEYIQWSEQWMNKIYHATKSKGSFWLNVGYLEVPSKGKAVPITYLLWDKTPFYMVQEVVWNYGAGVSGRKFLSPRNEKLLWYVKDMEDYVFNLDEIRDKNVKYPNQKKNGKLRCNPLGKNPSDVWQIAKVTSGKNRSSKERTPHPAQFPVELINRVVKASSNQGDVVLDPFMGSGTAAQVALENGRKFVGFELKEEYCNYAIQRIEQVMTMKKQDKLFGSV